MRRLCNVALILFLNGLSNERGRPSFYTGEGRFPPFLIRKHLSTALRKSRGHSTSNMGLIGLSGGSADPLLTPFGPIFSWCTSCGLLMGIAGCILRGMPVCSGLWGLLVSEMQDWIIYAFLLHSLVFSFVFQLCVPTDHNSPKLMELD